MSKLGTMHLDKLGSGYHNRSPYRSIKRIWRRPRLPRPKRPAPSLAKSPTMKHQKPPHRCAAHGNPVRARHPVPVFPDPAQRSFHSSFENVSAVLLDPRMRPAEASDSRRDALGRFYVSLSLCVTPARIGQRTSRCLPYGQP
jgi:hypothetical protein